MKRVRRRFPTSSLGLPVLSAKAALGTLALLVAFPSEALDWCAVEIHVRDGEYRPLAEVAVALESPLLFDQREVTTGTNGKARISALPPGRYRAQFFRPGYQWVEVEEIVCHPQAVLKLVVGLEAVKEDEIVILSSGPAVDMMPPEARRVAPREAREALPENGPTGVAATRPKTGDTKTFPEATSFSGLSRGIPAIAGKVVEVISDRLPTAEAHGRLSLGSGAGLAAAPTRTREASSTILASSRARVSVTGVSDSDSLRSFFALEGELTEWRESVKFDGSTSDTTVRRRWPSKMSSGSLAATLRRKTGDAQEVDLRVRAETSRQNDLATTLHLTPHSQPSSFDRTTHGFSTALGWSLVATDRIALRAEASVGGHGDEVTTAGNGVLEQDQSPAGVLTDGLGNGVWFGAGGLPSHRDRQNEAELGARLDGSAGAHNLTATLRWRRSERRLTYLGSSCCAMEDPEWGGRRYWRNASSSYLDLPAPPARMRADLTDSGFLLADHWQVSSSLSAVIGLEMHDIRFDGGPNRAGYTIPVGDTLSPRLGLVWDFEGNGRSRAWMRWARYRPDVGGTVRLRLAGALDVETLSDSPTLGEELRPPGAVTVAPNFVPAVEEQTALGVEYEVLSNFVVGFAAIHHRLRDGVAALSTDDGRSIAVGRPQGDLWPEDLHWEKLEALLRLHKRWSNGWQAEVVAAWSRLEGTWEGPAAVDLTDPDREWLRDVVVPAALENADGPLPGDRRVRLEILGSWTFETGPVVGGRLGYRSGAPVSYLGALDAGFGLDRRFVEDRGSSGRTRGLWQMDIVAIWPFEVGNAVVEARLEALNLADFGRAVVRDERWSLLDEDQAAGLNAVAQRTSGTWGEALEIQAPPEIRLGLAYRW